MAIDGAFVYVDPTNGDDSNPAGNVNQPWKTLTYALCVTAPGKTVRALAGAYSAASGEHFPLTIRGQRLDSVPSQGAVVEGVGPVAGDTTSATFDLQVGTATSRINGFKITGKLDHHGIGVLVRDGAGTSAVLLQDLGITGHDVGILVQGTTPDADIILSSLTGNQVNLQVEGTATVRAQSVTLAGGHTGVKVLDDAHVSLRTSPVTASTAQNVEVSSPNVDLGRVGSAGSNTFQGATGVNIWNRTSGTLTAVGNTVDPRPLTQGNTNQNDGAQNLANEFFPQGCTRVQASDCP